MHMFLIQIMGARRETTRQDSSVDWGGGGGGGGALIEVDSRKVGRPTKSQALG